MKKIFCVVCICVWLTTLIGCYDNNEIDSLATVMAIGIEPLPDEKTKLYTFAVSDNGGYSKDASGDSSGMICYMQKAETPDMAINMLNGKISKKISLSHLSAIIVSEGFNICDDMMYFHKQFRVRPHVMLAMSSLSPRIYLEKLNPQLETNPEKYFRRVFQKSETYAASLRLVDFINAYFTDATSLIPVITHDNGEVVNEDNAYISTSALIYKGTKIAELNNNSFLGLYFSDREVTVSEMVLKSVKKPKVVVDLNKKHILINLYVQNASKKAAYNIEKNAEDMLNSWAKKGIDVINVKKIIKKHFLNDEKYKKFNSDNFLEKSVFTVKVNGAEV